MAKHEKLTAISQTKRLGINVYMAQNGTIIAKTSSSVVLSHGNPWAKNNVLQYGPKRVDPF